MNALGVFPFLLFLCWLAFHFFKKRRANLEARRMAKKAFLEDISIGLSLKKKDYLLDERGGERGNPIERRFKRRHFFDLLEVFENVCAYCGKEGVKLTLDHFFIPKSQGGNLMVKNKRGYWVSNALPLCRKCNQRKRDLPAEQFFQPEELKVLREKTGELSWLINGFSQVGE